MRRIGEKITMLVILAEVVAMVVMFMFLNIWLSNILEDRVISDMGIIAHHRADLAENFLLLWTKLNKNYLKRLSLLK